MRHLSCNNRARLLQGKGSPEGIFVEIPFILRKLRVYEGSAKSNLEGCLSHGIFELKLHGCFMEMMADDLAGAGVRTEGG